MKEGTDEPLVRRKLVAMEVARGIRFDTFAGTAPLKCIKIIISRAASIKNERGRHTRVLALYDIGRVLETGVKAGRRGGGRRCGVRIYQSRWSWLCGECVVGSSLRAVMLHVVVTTLVQDNKRRRRLNSVNETLATIFAWCGIFFRRRF